VGISPQLGEIERLYDFFDCPVLSCPFFHRSRAQIVLGHGWSDLDDIWYADAESHADDEEISKWKLEVEFQYGGRLLSEIGNTMCLKKHPRHF